MVHLREVRHWKHRFLRQYSDSLESIDRQWYEVCELERSKIYLSSCLWVCLSLYHKGILPLANDLVIHHCLGLKHNFFRQRRLQVKTIRIGQHKENMWWWLRINLVTQVVSESVQCSKGFELKQQNMIACLYVCLSATSLQSSLLKIWLFSLITILYNA